MVQNSANDALNALAHSCPTNGLIAGEAGVDDIRHALDIYIFTRASALDALTPRSRCTRARIPIHPSTHPHLALALDRRKGKNDRPSATTIEGAGWGGGGGLFES